MSHAGGVMAGPAVIGLLLALRLGRQTGNAPLQDTAVRAYGELFGVLAAVALGGGLCLAMSGHPKTMQTSDCQS
jgi:hypothetical protein